MPPPSIGSALPVVLASLSTGATTASASHLAPGPGSPPSPCPPAAPEAPGSPSPSSPQQRFKAVSHFASGLGPPAVVEEETDVERTLSNGGLPDQTQHAGTASATASQPRLTRQSSFQSVGQDPLSSLALTLNIPWILRVRSNSPTQELCRWFGIPETDNLLDDFHCALRKRVLLQGRLFVFDHYVCFHTNVFGYVKKKVLHIPDIMAIRKKSHFRIPNSIEIQDVRGDCLFFTSFLTRESAYKLIVGLWSQSRPSLTGTPPNDTLLGRDGGRHPSAEDGTAAGPSSKAESSSLLGGRPPLPAPRSGSAPVAPGSVPLARTLTADLDLPYQSTPSNAEDECGEEREEDGESDDVLAAIETEPIPHRHPSAKLLLSTRLPGTPHLFYEALLANDSQFIEDVYEQLGYRRIIVASWKRTERLGHVRDVQFTAPLKGFGAWGVPNTRCFITQRFCQYPGQVFLFESQQTNMDIPYGDCFTVDQRWEVRPCDAPTDTAPDAGAATTAAAAAAAAAAGPGAATPHIKVDVYLSIPFSRMCLFKKVIESGTYSQCRETAELIVERMRVTLSDAWRERVERAALAARGTGLVGAVGDGEGGGGGLRVGLNDACGEGLGGVAADSPGHESKWSQQSLLPRQRSHLALASTPMSMGLGGGTADARRGTGRGARVAWILLALLMLVVMAAQVFLLWWLRTQGLQPSGGGAASQPAPFSSSPPLSAALFPSTLRPDTSFVAASGAAAGSGTVPIDSSAPPPPPPVSASSGGAEAGGHGECDAGCSMRLQLLMEELGVLRRRVDLVVGEVGALLGQTSGDP